MIDTEPLGKNALAFVQRRPRGADLGSPIGIGSNHVHSPIYEELIGSVNECLIDDLCITHRMKGQPPKGLREPHERLAWAQADAGYDSAAAAARAMGMKYSTYAAHVNGTTAFPRDAAKRYASFFRVSMDWLVMGRGSPRGARPPIQEIYESLPPDLQRQATDYLEFLQRRGLPE